MAASGLQNGADYVEACKESFVFSLLGFSKVLLFLIRMKTMQFTIYSALRWAEESLKSRNKEVAGRIEHAFYVPDGGIQGPSDMFSMEMAVIKRQRSM